MPPLPSLKQLNYLVALSEHLNFTRAAESCFVTQSTLSAGLKELEETLGARLVERDRQTVLMTPIGLEVARRARDILAETQDLVELASRSTEPMSGQIRLGVIPTIAPFLLPPALTQLRARYPDLRLALREDQTASLLSRLEEGQLDFALITLPYTTDKLLVEPLFDDRLWLVARADDPEIKKKTVRMTPYLSEHLLLLEEGHCLRDHTLYACSGKPSPLANLEATSLLTLIQMVESGLGIALIPEMAINSSLMSSAALAVRPFTKPEPMRTIALVARRSTPRLVEMEALAAIFRKA